MSSCLRVAALAGALLVPAACFASAIDFMDALITRDSQLSLGFVFTSKEAVNITSLGYYDENQDGFLTDHEVGIFDSDGQLLVSVTLSAGSDSLLVGFYRYELVTPITLPANQSFTIAATTFGPDDGWAYGYGNSSITGFATDPSIEVANDASRFIYQNDDVS